MHTGTVTGGALAHGLHLRADPRDVVRQRPVGVRLVVERRAGGQRRRVFGGAVLGAARARHHACPCARRRARNRSLLRDPRGIAWLHAEEVAQEILLGGVFIEPADEIGDRAVEIIAADDRGVEQQAAGRIVDHAGLVVGHAFEHLELDAVLDALAGRAAAWRRPDRTDCGWRAPILTNLAFSGWHPSWSMRLKLASTSSLVG